MDTLKTNMPAWAIADEQKADDHVEWKLIKKFNHFADGQAKNHTLWWFVNLMVHGNLVLAVPAVLIYYFHAPIWLLVVTFVCFFSTFVANMCGGGIRATLATFFISLLIHSGLILYYVFL